MESVRQFLGKEAEIGPEKRVSIIPAPLAKTLSWGRGADLGPAAILDASPALEVFDDELLLETVAAGIETLAPLDLADCSPEEACQDICRAVGRELELDRLPVVLGGEHTVSVGAIAACVGRYPDLHVVQVDAHLDLREQYEGSPLSHACVMRRLDDLGLSFTQVGIRSFSGEEYGLLRQRRWQPFFMHRIKQEQDWVEQICREIHTPVYLTFDVDALDPAIMPATGTPEPDGLSWAMAVALLRGVARSTKIVGLDFVEFSPRPGAEHAAFLVAKLVYRALGYIYQPFLDTRRGEER